MHIYLLKFPPQRKNYLKKKYTIEYMIRSLFLDLFTSSSTSSLLATLTLISLLLSLRSLKSFICSWMNCTKISTIKF